MKKLITFVAVVALATPAFAAPVDASPGVSWSNTNNGDGTTTWWVGIEAEPLITFLEFELGGDLNQVPANSDLYALVGPDWAPNVYFSSDQTAALATDPDYDTASNGGATDTVISDEGFISYVEVQPTPGDASESLFVAMTSFTGGVGGPIAGGTLSLAHFTIPTGSDAWITGGKLQQLVDGGDDLDTRFYFHTPEPSTLALAGFGLMGLVASMRRRRS